MSPEIKRKYSGMDEATIEDFNLPESLLKGTRLRRGQALPLRRELFLPLII